MKQTAWLILLILIVTPEARAQLWTGIDFLPQGTYTDSVAIGDTAVVQRYHLSSYLDGCSSDITEYRFGDTVHFGGYYGLVHYSPTTIGSNSTTLDVTITGHSVRSCGGSAHGQITVTGVGISDSFSKIRPQGWPITMQRDTVGLLFKARFSPAFDNPISDTTLFSHFQVMPSNGVSAFLQIFDTSAPIIDYVSPPFQRKKRLNFLLSSLDYRSFDTVQFMTRMRNHGVDSLVNYTLPVTWLPADPIVTHYAFANGYYIGKQEYYYSDSILVGDSGIVNSILLTKDGGWGCAHRWKLQPVSPNSPFSLIYDTNDTSSGYSRYFIFFHPTIVGEIWDTIRCELLWINSQSCVAKDSITNIPIRAKGLGLALN